MKEKQLADKRLLDAAWAFIAEVDSIKEYSRGTKQHGLAVCLNTKAGEELRAAAAEAQHQAHLSGLGLPAGTVEQVERGLDLERLLAELPWATKVKVVSRVRSEIVDEITRLRDLISRARNRPSLQLPNGRAVEVVVSEEGLEKMHTQVRHMVEVCKKLKLYCDLLFDQRPTDTESGNDNDRSATPGQRGDS